MEIVAWLLVQVDIIKTQEHSSVTLVMHLARHALDRQLNALLAQEEYTLRTEIVAWLLAQQDIIKTQELLLVTFATYLA